MRRQERKPHHVRAVAQSFGADPDGYDRLRPTYPAAMVDVVLDEAPGLDLLDVGCGTGISSRPFQDAGCRVLGVEPDPRMARVAAEQGLEVEVASFEEWPIAGRMFDAVISGTTWHWIEPRAGARRAADVLRPGGVFAAFWNVPHLAPALAPAFTAIYRRIAPGSPFAKPSDQSHTRILDRAFRGVLDTQAFDVPRIRRFPWDHDYTRDEWLELVPTFGGTHLLSPELLVELLAGLGTAIDAAGGAFTVRYETLLLTATRS